MKMSDEEALRVSNEIAGEYGMKVEYLGDVRTVGVQGDQRTYERPVCLTGEFPGWDVIDEIKTAISNRTPINRVTIDIPV